MCHIIVCAKHSHDSKDTIVATKVKISFTFCALLAIDVKKSQNLMFQLSSYSLQFFTKFICDYINIRKRIEVQ